MKKRTLLFIVATLLMGSLCFAMPPKDGNALAWNEVSNVDGYWVYSSSESGKYDDSGRVDVGKIIQVKFVDVMAGSPDGYFFVVTAYVDNCESLFSVNGRCESQFSNEVQKLFFDLTGFPDALDSLGIIFIP
jgi:hypothetical protein